MHDILRRAAVVPVIVVHELRHAVPLAEALVEGGLPVLEFTLRTPVALQAIEAVRKAVPRALVGAGTITQPEQFAAAGGAGAQFGVSPGFSASLIEASRRVDYPFLPGVMTPGELLQVRELGFTSCKFFPALQAGGTGTLRALHAVFPDVQFCPTGGISQHNAAEYLALPNVACVGGAWVAPETLVRESDWSAIRHLATAAAALKANQR